MTFPRTIRLPKQRSFFLFGARGTGKSTLLRSQYPAEKTLVINLLDLETEALFAREPSRLKHQVLALSPDRTHVVVDEVQKMPKLLDVVHDLIETHQVPQSFVLTGSSARKLKRGGANLLAGRAALRRLYPLTPGELESSFDMTSFLAWGGLPALWNTSDLEERKDILVAYSQVYLKEEIWNEQIVRQLDPFRRFAEVAAVQSGKVLNFTKIARDVGVDVKTIQSWYEVLEDTLLGFHLDAFSASVRKQLRQAPKFYFVDTGIARALSRTLSVEPHPSTSYYGELFEQQMICIIRAQNDYDGGERRFSYLQTKAGVEIDLVVERPGLPTLLIEIKSTAQVTLDDAKTLRMFEEDFPDAEFMILSQDPAPQTFGRVKALPWWEGLKQI